jgi:CheY-like chemotaxis protein
METTALIGPALPKGVSIDLHGERDAVWILADETQIRQVVMNVLANAAESMRDGGGRVVVTTETVLMDVDSLNRCTIPGTSVPGDYCRIAVADHGVGMEPETIDKIFDPFFTTKLHGRGLGLASTLGIVRSNGGNIHVESKPKCGTTFTLLFPSAQPRRVAERDPEPALPAGNETILVIDDEDLVRVATRRMLEAWGYRVIDANSGSRAVEIIAGEDAIDLACLDLTMPGMSGEETFTALRAVDPDLPVIFMSGHNREDITRRFADSERTWYVTKPVPMGELRRNLAALLANAGG